MGICCVAQGTQSVTDNLEGRDGVGGGRELHERGHRCNPVADS